jgi:Zn-dependent protease
LLTIGFGWGNPVPVNYYNLKYPKWGPALVSIGGPISNLLMVIVSGIIFKLLAPAGLNPINLNEVIGGSNNLMLIFLAFLIFYNIILMVFNLIPVPPLDGSKVLFAALPDKYYEFKAFMSSRGPIILFALLLIDSFTNLGIFNFLFGHILGFFARFF